MTPTVPSARTRLKAQVVQRIAYLLVAIALGWCWYPLAKGLNSEPIPGTDLVPTAIWVTASGLLYGTVFRGIAIRRGREPSLWFAALFPLFGTLGRAFASFVTHGGAGEDLAYDFLMSTLAGYTCFGTFLIPVAVAHVAALRWTHRRLEVWAQSANWRMANQGAYAVASVILLAGVEGTRYVRSSVLTGQEVARGVGFEVPWNTYVAGRSSHGTTKSFWLRSDRNLPWPPQNAKQSMPLTDPEDDFAITERARIDAKADPRGHDMKVRSVKWIRGDQLIQVNLVRIGSVDYMEVIPW
ncbi:MAG: hypothetical protein ACO1SV_07820 [Fimbriimonas sp.]